METDSPARSRNMSKTGVALVKQKRAHRPCVALYRRVGKALVDEKTFDGSVGGGSGKGLLLQGIRRGSVTNHSPLQE